MTNSSGFEIRVADVISVISRRRYSVAISTFVAALLAGILAFSMAKVYRLESLLAPVITPQPGGAENLLGQLGGLSQVSDLLSPGGTIAEEEAIAYLQSRTLARDFIERERLLPVLFANDISTDVAQNSVEGTGEMPSVWDGVKKFEEEIRFVERDRASGLVRFAIEWHDPTIALNWNMALVAEANARMRERSINEAERNIKFLEGELNKTNIVEIRQAIYQLMETQIKAIMLAQARPDFAFRIIDQPLLPDADAFVRPQRMLLVAVGAFLGFMLSSLASIWWDRHLLTSS